MQMRID